MSTTTATRRALAPILTGRGRSHREVREYPPPGPGQLLLEVRANALCGTDRGFWEHGAVHVPGHESAGIVIETGPGVDTAVGTPGVVYLMDFCGACRSCRVGATNQCSAKRADRGITEDGGLARYELVHASQFHPVPKTLDLGTATMLLDVMGTSTHAIARARAVRPDVESVYIAGAGPIGIGILIMSKLLLGDHVPVHISDVSPWRLDFAASFGGLPVDATEAHAMQRVGVPDVAFDASGKTSARRAALDVLAPRGALVCVGHGEGLTLDASGDLIAPEHAVLGSEYFRFDDLTANLDLLLTHTELISRVITHRVPADELELAFELFLSGCTGKVVIEQGPA